MWPFKKKSEKPKTKIGTYRIAPYRDGLFVVEEYNYPRWSWYESDPCWQKAEEYSRELGSYRDLTFKTDHEAEKWIRNKIESEEARRAAEIERQSREKAHAEKNPPREVPPYRFK